MTDTEPDDPDHPAAPDRDRSDDPSVCSLCDLPTPDPPVTDPDGELDGTFCCRGCLEVARSLDGAPATGTTAVDPAAELRDDADGSDDAHDAGATDTASTSDADTADAFLRVDGMHCGTCEAFVESRATDRQGVLEAEASYAADLCRVVYDEGTVDPAVLPDALSGLGYEAHLVGTASGTAESDRGDRSLESPGVNGGEVGGRLLLGVLFGMMVMVWYVLFFYPAYLGVDPSLRLFALDGSAGDFLRYNVWVLASIVLLYTGYPILRGAYVSLRAGHPNMDLLVALAAGTAYLYSAVATVLGRPEVYFDITVAVVLVVTVGDYYKDRVKRGATDRLTDLTRSRVRTARRRVVPASASAAAADSAPPGTGPDEPEADRPGGDADGGGGVATETVSVEELAAGDELVVKPGERIPVDGTVSEGTAAVDESLVTGEATPVRVEPGEEVVGGAVVTDGGLVVTAGEGADSTLDRLLRRLWSIQSARPGAQRLADRLAAVFVPLVVVLATAVTGYHLLTGAAPADALLTGLAVLVVSCPCALGLATPLAVAAGVRGALERGVVVADESVFERATATDTVVVDKTGTLTTGRSRLERVETVGGDGGATTEGGRAVAESDATSGPTERELLARAAAVEQFAEHPLAGAIVDAAPNVETAADEFERYPGQGVGAVVTLPSGVATDGGLVDRTDDDRDGDGDTAVPESESDTNETAQRDGVEGAVGEGVETVVGRPSLFDDRGWTVPDRCRRIDETAGDRGALPALVGWDGEVRGVVVAGDDPRPEWRDTLARLAADGRRIVVLTGDDGAAADRFRGHDAVDEVYAGVPPEGKAETVARLSREGTVAMVGDGSNDAPALATADLGIAMGTGTELAADAAEVVVTGGLASVPAVFEMTRATRRRVRENLAWAFLYNVVAVPLALVGLVNPLFAALAMSASSVLVVANSTRSFGVAIPDTNPGTTDRDRGEPGTATRDGASSA
jgi:Cu2+-exporting ATPase